MNMDDRTMEMLVYESVKAGDLRESHKYPDIAHLNWTPGDTEIQTLDFQ